MPPTARLPWQGTSLRLWETATGKERLQLEVQPGAGWNLAFSPDARTIATGGADGTIRLYDVATGKERRRFPGSGKPVVAVAFCADGKSVASTDSNSITVWDATGLARDAAKLTAQEVATLWKDLAGADAARAYQATWTLAASPDEVVKFLKDQVPPRPAPANQDELARLIKQLDDDDFAIRQKAMAQLEKQGEAAGLALRLALMQSPPLELRRRVEELLQKLDGVALPPERLRWLRAVEVLERINSPPARQLLEEVARTHAGSRLGEEASASLARMAR